MLFITNFFKKIVIHFLLINTGKCFARSYNIVIADLRLMERFFKKYALEKTVQ